MQRKIFIGLIYAFAVALLITCVAAFMLSGRVQADTNTVPYIMILTLIPTALCVASCLIARNVIKKTVKSDIAGTIEVLHRVSSGEVDARTEVKVCEELWALNEAINFMLDSMNKSTKVRTEELTALINEVNAEKEQAENANRTKSAFFSSLGHEIRTPMNAIVGISELLTEEDLDLEHLEQIRNIKEYCDSLLGIIDDLVDFSSMEDGSFLLQSAHYDFNALLEHIAAEARLSAREKGLEFKTEIAADLPKFLNGDSAKLHRVLVNLLSNAVKFTQNGLVSFSTALSEDSEKGEKKLKFTVSDTGTGIKPDDLPRLFEPYLQVDGRKERGRIGAGGVGLIITDRIVSMMGGSISVESIYGFGSTFRIEIPFEVGSETLIGLKTDETTYVSAPEANILLVDDIDINLTVGSGFFKLHDIYPDVASSAKEAIKKICAKDYDIVFMDHMMPEMDGAAATEAIRKFGGKYAKGGDGLKIIALTANVSSAIREKLLKSGMDDFLPKPITKASLNHMLIMWLPEKKCEIKTKKGNHEIQPEDYSDVVKAADKITGINVRHGLRRVGGGLEEFENSLKLLARRIPRSVDEINQCLAGNRLYDLAIEVHGMKGALAINGIDELAKLAGEIETHAKSRNREACAKKLPRFVKKLTTLCAEIDGILARAAQVPKKEGSGQLLSEFVEYLIEIVGRFDRNMALDEVNKAMTYTFGKKHDRYLEEIKADLEDFDYDSAMARLQRFKLK
jgi:signal transduction histidine kinase/HPt (histidine-containing phosphotransfer) domain-containing protein/FixJ family two-component response regulator